MKMSNATVVDSVMLDVDWDNWGLVLQLGSFEKGVVMTPNWADMPKKGALEGSQTKIPISSEALQKLADALWKKGIVPEGLTIQVTEDTHGIDLPESVRKRLDRLVSDFNVAKRSEGDPRVMFWDRYTTAVVVSVGDDYGEMETLGSFRSLGKLIEFLDEEDSERSTSFPAMKKEAHKNEQASATGGK